MGESPKFSEKNTVLQDFSPINFSRNDYFLDATDRKLLLTYAGKMATMGCLRISLQGTRDAAKGGLPDIDLLRAKAVRNYLVSLYGQFKFNQIERLISDKRQVKITCTN